MIISELLGQISRKRNQNLQDGSEHDSSIRTYGNCILQSEHMKTIFFNQNMALQHMETMFYALTRTSPFESHFGLLRSEYHQAPKPCKKK